MEIKITTADLSEGRNVTAVPSLVQWDRRCFLVVSGADLPAAYKWEFANKGDTATVPAVVYEDRVEIPNALLKTGRPITAYLVMVYTDGRSTEYWITINVKPRPEPKDEVPDPGQASEIDQLISALNSGVEAAEGYAEDAETQAGFSETFAGDAAAAATLAESWAVGGTGTRENEDVNNAWFWSEAAKMAAGKDGWVHFYIDDQGVLHYVKTENAALSFYIDVTGILHVTNG